MISPDQLTSPVGLIAGNGCFPLEFAESARRRGLSVVAVAHKGETEQRIEELVEECTWISVGEVGKLIDSFKRRGVRHAAFAGGIRRVKLFAGFKPDLRAVALIARTRSLQDDVILREVAREIERSGIEVFSASLLLEKSVPGAGLLTRRKLSSSESASARCAWDAAKGIGALDIGQTVVAHQGVIVAVEAIEGTDAAVARAGELAGTSKGVKPGDGCVVVKLAKPQQDLRFDLPAVGRETIEVMQRAGATALLLEAGKAIILDAQEFVRRADAAGIAVAVASSPDEIG